MDYEEYLRKGTYEWKDLFIFCIDENKGLQDVIINMIDYGYLDEISEEDMYGLIDYLENKLRSAQ